MKRLLILAVLALGSSLASAQTINALSCSSLDVSNALSSISVDGTVVVLPPCAATDWTSTVTYTQTNSFTLQGAGAIVAGAQQSQTCAAGSDSTTLRDNIDRSGSDPAMLRINTILGKTFRMTGVAFTYNAGNATTTFNGSVQISGFSQSVRVDHNHFYSIKSLSLAFTQWEYGVFDHNCLEGLNGNAVFTAHSAWNNHLNGNGSWADDTQWGSSKFMFYEDNTFISSHAFIVYADDCNYGGRITFRYNTLVGPTGFQQHDESSQNQGCRATDVNHNWFANLGTATNPGFYARSGTALIWGNTFTGFNVAVGAHNDRSDILNNARAPAPQNFGVCGGTLPRNGTVNTNGTTTVTWASGAQFDTNWPASTPIRIVVSGGNAFTVQSVASATSLTVNAAITTASGSTYEVGSSWDGNTDNYGYPCFDQMGRGKGDLLSDTGLPSVVNTAATVGGIGTATINAAGSGYIVGDKLTVVQGGASGGLINVTATSGSPGPITGISVVEAGTGYTIANGLTTTGGTGTGATFNSTGLIAWPHQALDPVYVFENTFNAPGGSPKYWSQGQPNDNQVIKENRDYYLELPNFDNQGASFNGTAGVGQGLLSARPATCTPLVGYFATDTNTLYQCATTDTWTTFYTPYTYPHPLVTQGSGTAPARGFFANRAVEQPVRVAIKAGS